MPARARSEAGVPARPRPRKKPAGAAGTARRRTVSARATAVTIAGGGSGRQKVPGTAAGTGRRSAKRKPRAPWLRPAALCAVLLTAAVLAAWVPLSPIGGGSATRIWRGYHPLLVRAGSNGVGTARLSAALGPGVASEATASVEFWDFSGPARVKVSDIARRFDPLDPRYDPWISAIGGYFRVSAPGGSWDVLYVPAAMPLPRLWLRVAGQLGVPWRGEWWIPELDLAQAILSLGSLFSFVLLFAFSLGRGRRAAVAAAAGAAVLCSPISVAGGIAATAACLLLLASWSRVLGVLVDHEPRRPPRSPALRRPLGEYAALAAAGSVLLIISRPPGTGMVVAFAGVSVSLLLVLAALDAGRGLAGRPQRATFEPVPIVRPAADRARRGLSLAAVASVALLVLAALVPVVRGVPLPAPSPVPGVRGYSWDALAALARARRSARIPDWADLVTHDAYQETIAVGRPWKLPTADERVTVREYRTVPATGAVTEHLRTVKVFDAVWLASVRRRALPGSVESVLFAQPRPVAVALRGPAGFVVPALPALLGALLVLLAGAADGRNRRPLIRALYLRFTMAARRNQAP